jgi:predicted NACHT family NTPase
LLAVSFSRFFIFAGFELNKNYIAANLCENRDKPWLHCNGKCYFAKKIKQAQENERNDERQSQKNLFQEALITTSSPVKFQNYLLYIIDTPYHSGGLAQYNGTLFHPPQIG